MSAKEGTHDVVEVKAVVVLENVQILCQLIEIYSIWAFIIYIS